MKNMADICAKYLDQENKKIIEEVKEEIQAETVNQIEILKKEKIKEIDQIKSDDKLKETMIEVLKEVNLNNLKDEIIQEEKNLRQIMEENQEEMKKVINSIQNKEQESIKNLKELFDITNQEKIKIYVFI